MKANRLAQNALNIVRNGTDRQQLAVIYVAVMVATAVLLAVMDVAIMADTPTYFDAGRRLMTGELDSFRTPVYPLLCYFAEWLSRTHCNTIIVSVQIMAFYASVFFMYRLCNELISHRSIAFSVSLIYALLPSVMSFAMCILTDSLSTSLLVVYCYTCIKSYKTTKKAYPLYNFLLLLTLLFLRPIFVFLLPLSLALWAYGLFRQRRNVAMAMNLAFVVLTTAVLLSYCKAYERRYGYLAVSVVSDINQYVILRITDLQDPSVIGNEQLREDVVAYMNTEWEAVHPIESFYYEAQIIRDEHGEKALHDYVKANLSKHFVAYGIANIKRVLSESGQSILTMYYKQDKNEEILECVKRVMMLCSITFFHLYVLLLALILSFAYMGFKRRTLPILTFFLWSVVAANVFIAVFGAQGEFSRLILPSLPILLVVLGVWLSMYKMSLRSDYNVL